MADAERIWLEPECCAEPGVGRTWCSVNEWACCPAGECDAPKPTEYVRADLVAAREAAAAEAMREACAQYCNGRERIYAARACAASDVPDQVVAAGMAACFESAEDAIRALPIPAADALARALERARAEGMEAAAAILEREAAHWREWSAGELARNAAAAIRARGKETSGE